ncbi:hypothetical protein [Streptacidiphilus albus]|uniref:hypothetical protein n=1 Tax=Streptacidiphilus albus TaxID=105425 RepID=UPI00054B61B5|nr:hypothetical protein [Streptacidiphilus albus]
MKLKFIGTTSEDGNCPTLYEIEGDTERVVVQGDILDDPEALAQLRNVLPRETFVIVPKALLTRFASKE